MIVTASTIHIKGKQNITLTLDRDSAMAVMDLLEAVLEGKQIPDAPSLYEIVFDQLNQVISD